MKITLKLLVIIVFATMGALISVWAIEKYEYGKLEQILGGSVSSILVALIFLKTFNPFNRGLRGTVTVNELKIMIMSAERSKRGTNEAIANRIKSLREKIEYSLPRESKLTHLTQYLLLCNAVKTIQVQSEMKPPEEVISQKISEAEKEIEELKLITRR